MGIGVNINKLMSEKRARKIKLAQHLGVARNTLDDYISERTFMTTDKLILLADFFKVPVSYFFDEDLTRSNNVIVSDEKNKVQSGNVNIMVEQQEKEIEHLKILLREKERVLEEKERTINILLNQNK